MKAVLFWLVILLLTFNACVKKETETFITGRFPDSRNSTLNLVSIDNYFPDLGTNNIIASTKTDSIGNFTFKIKQIQSGFFQILKNKYPAFRYDIFVEAGDSIYIEQSSWNEDPYLSISGKGSEKLKYLTEDYKIFPKGKAFNEKLNSKEFEKALSFKIFIDSIQNIRIKTLNSNTTISGKLKAIFKNDIYAESAELLFYHLERRNYIMKGSFDYYYPDTSYYSFLNNLNFDNSFCHSTAIKKMAPDYLNAKARIAFKKEDETRYWEENLSWKFNYVSNQPKSIWTDLLALSTIYDYSFGLMQDDFFDKLKAFSNKMERLFYSKSYQQVFKNNVSEYFILSPGMPAPDFALPDSEGNIIRLSDFKGKVVYIDFWGTWCYPCIQEIPEAIKLQKKYKNKPVVFLYVALEYNEKNIARWKNFIAGKDKRFAEFLDHKAFPGIHLVAEKQFQNENIKPYKINFAPTYVLIDQDGNIVSARAERPDKVSEQIDELIERLEN